VNRKNRPSGDAADLREQAEELAREKAAQSPEYFETLSQKQIKQTLHELRVHQIELEMQNDELRRAQEELEITRERYFDLYDMAPIGYITTDEKGLILGVNLTFAKLLGIARGTLLKKPFTSYVARDDQYIYYQHRKMLFETSKPQSCELRMVRQDKTPIWVRLDTALAQNSDGTPACRVMVGDITERKIAELKIAESEQRFRQLSENIDLVFWLTDWTEKKLLYVNPAYETVFGMTVKSAYADRTGWKKAIHPDDLEYVGSEFQSHAAKGEHLEMDYRILCDGKVKWIRERALPLRDGNGLVVQYINVAEDITERKKAEDNLVESMARYRLLADNSTDVVWILDLKTRRLTYYSPSVMKLRGYTPEEAMAIPLDKMMTQESYANIIHDIEMLLEEDSASGLDPDRMHIIESEEFCKDGSTVFVEARLKFLRDDSGKPTSIIGSTRDITQRKWAEDESKLLSMRLQSIADEKTLELEKAHAAMVKQERLAVLGQMAASVSHELRNPLSVINNVAFYLKTKLPDLDEKSLQMLELLDKEVMRSDRIIGDMLGFSRQKPNLVEDVSLNELVESYFSSPDVKPGNIELKLKLAPDLVPIRADIEKLKQILDNLVINAFQAMPGGGTLTITTGIGKSGTADLSVEDTGCGMSPEIMAKIFEPLFSTKTTGFGLGLAIVKTLVVDHGGELEVDSKEGKGSVFTVRLPFEGVVQ